MVSELTLRGSSRSLDDADEASLKGQEFRTMVSDEMSFHPKLTTAQIITVAMHMVKNTWANDDGPRRNIFSNESKAVINTDAVDES